MAVALREGGLYRVGDSFVDAEGKPVKDSEAKRAIAARESGGSAEAVDEFEDMSREDLIAAAEKRGLTVTRADGKDGAPLVSDYQAALRA